MIAERISGLQALRAIAAGYVLLFHLIPAAGLVEMWPRMASFSRWGFVGVDLFFVLSGFVMWHSTTSRVGKSASCQFLALRFARIFSGYWPMLAIAMLVFLVIAPQALSDKNILGSVLLLDVDDTHLLISVAWSLSYELYFYCLFAILIVLNPSSRIVAIAVVFLAVVVFNYLLVSLCPKCLSGGSGDGYFLFSPFVGEFLLGSLVSWAYGRTARYSRLAFSEVVLALLIVAAGIWMEVGDGKLPEQQIDRLISFGVASAGLVYAVAVIGSRIHWPRWIVAMGDRSYALYLGHPLLITVASVSSIFPLDAFSHRWHGMVAIILFVGVALGFAHGYHLSLERPLYRKLRHLLKAGLIASDRPDGRK